MGSTKKFLFYGYFIENTMWRIVGVLRRSIKYINVQMEINNTRYSVASSSASSSSGSSRRRFLLHIWDLQSISGDLEEYSVAV